MVFKPAQTVRLAMTDKVNSFKNENYLKSESIFHFKGVDHKA